ncbi:DUF192 domain-containing protein [archaeon]|nr:DUF192 domain-containing protein [archaeon]
MEIMHGNVILADKVKLCDNIFSRSKGLMFSKKIKEGQALLFESEEESIFSTTMHMLFVFFNIDIVWLNSNKKVVDVKSKVKSFTPFIAPVNPAKYVLELPKGMSKNIKIGDVLDF